MTLLYLDTSALFKRYVEEAESEALLSRIEDAPVVGTALITQVEVVAALAPQWTGQNRPFVDTAKPAISGARDGR